MDLSFLFREEGSFPFAAEGSVEGALAIKYVEEIAVARSRVR